MRRRLQALACLGSLAAMSIPASSPASASQTARPTRTQTAPAQSAQTVRAVQAEQAGLAGRAAQRSATTQEPPTQMAQAVRIARSLPATGEAGEALESAGAACRVLVARPVVDAGGMLRAAATRTGCDDPARLRVRVKQAVTGPDRTLKSGSRVLRNGSVSLRLRCSATPRRYYVTALDYTGGSGSSRTVSLSCGGSARTGQGASTAESEVVRLTNQARARNGCRPLTHDPQLRRAAERHSADMATRGYFDHTGRNGSSVGDRIRAAGFSPVRAWGENIAMGQSTAAQVVRGWLDSPGHRQNIMNCSFTHIGVGHHSRGPHWTQVFATH
ncbi:CAP domain-containing protein [Nonomuraea sp. CA-218870]|uniref:CAP domain-containing protein n=1 Tax=Nonomuraea sp. CA-218870 TaxID=3239998 RepID=UPI003D8A3DFA